MNCPDEPRARRLTTRHACIAYCMHRSINRSDRRPATFGCLRPAPPFLGQALLLHFQTRRQVSLQTSPSASLQPLIRGQTRAPAKTTRAEPSRPGSSVESRLGTGSGPAGIDRSRGSVESSAESGRWRALRTTTVRARTAQRRSLAATTFLKKSRPAACSRLATRPKRCVVPA